MSELAFTRTGSGAPLVLLHGIGSLRQAWAPVVPALAERFEVIAVDLPGFGESAPLPPYLTPTPAALANSVAAFLDRHDITAPHVAGTSLGGWIALELATLRRLASLALLSPAGLWPGRTPLFNRVSLRAIRWSARHAGGLGSRLVSFRLGRALVLGQIHGRPARVDPEYARMEIRGMGTCPGFEATMKAARPLHYRAQSPVDTPVSVAFGARDRILLASLSRRVEQLPPGAHIATLPGCGHVPMPDDPEAVAAFIVVAAARARVA
ncbi:alpha/beta fold hydrolase [Phytohabitans houttuyneae]|uniref:Hydrolase n=1 Tax=Phytohabitans houttuyneae TaxID=1076126 RepID=A0A6V8KL06_9ACTN|nr:alpha/beta fold hydrolase [Phytohabitans houttuyneae]GFJ82437.1 hydrolase [Phytohabitans houttuyneae]